MKQAMIYACCMNSIVLATYIAITATITNL